MKPQKFNVAALLLTIAFWLAIIACVKVLWWLLDAFGIYVVVTLSVLVASWPIYTWALLVVKQSKEQKP